MTLYACTVCGVALMLLAVISADRWLCPTCWRAAGRPFVYPKQSDEEAAMAEAETRKRMQARGGADRYRVGAGKS